MIIFSHLEYHGFQLVDHSTIAWITEMRSDCSIVCLLWVSSYHCAIIRFVSLWSGHWYKVKWWVLVVICRLLFTSGTGSFIECQIAWEKWSYTAVGCSLRGSFAPVSTVLIFVYIFFIGQRNVGSGIWTGKGYQ